ncbi:MAG: ATP-binding cassette domain-containing protein [Rickettsiales bacterium]
MLTLEHITIEYNIGQPILKDISLSLSRGSFHFLTGASGAGKSTLLSLLSLQIPAISGKFHMFDKNVTEMKREELPFLRRRIGIVLQDYRLLEHLTILENVSLPLRVIGEPEDVIAEKALELLEWVGLSEHQNSKPAILSGGQKQRAAIARAVITKPDILLADEPTGNLDSELAQRFMYLFEALNQTGTTVLVATHDENLISLFNYPTLRLKDGSLTKISPLSANISGINEKINIL